MLFCAGVLLFSLPFQGKAQTPSFVNGNTVSISVCENSAGYDFDSLLAVIDTPGGIYVDTWNISATPNHGGSIGGSIAFSGTFTQTDNTNPNTPPNGTFNYTPAPNYVGGDTFSIHVSGAGGNSATVTFYVSVTPPPALTLVQDTAVVCAGVTSTTLSFTGLVSLGPISDTFKLQGFPQTFTVPQGINAITFDALGGSGGSDNVSGSPNPGKGGRMQGTLNVTPGAVLNIYVGGEGFNGSPFNAAGGYNGGGTAWYYPGVGCGGGGGGASDIRLGGNALSNRVVVAGGGGGNGSDISLVPFAGGDGGGLTGANSAANLGGGMAGGGTQATYGLGATYSGWLAGNDGALGVGGGSSVQGVSGGGGAGLYGAGGGVWTGGGGGSSYADPVVTTLVTNTQGANIGDGQIVIGYTIAGTYSITWGPEAIGAGFVNVVNAPMTASPFNVSIPATAPQGVNDTVYTGTITINNGICSTDYTFGIQINTTPVISPVAGQSICAGLVTNQITPVSSVANTTYTWVNDNPSIGLPASGIDSVQSFTAADPTAIAIIGNITYTDSAAGCAGAPFTVSDTVYATPMINDAPMPDTICNFTTFNFTPTTGDTAVTTFAWSRAAIMNISNAAASGTGNPSEVLVDTSFTQQVPVTYVYTVSTAYCSNIQPITVVINPSSQLTSGVVDTVCSGLALNYVPTATTDTLTTTTFAWTRNAVPGLTNPMNSGSGSVTETLNSISTGSILVNYIYYLTAYGCTTPENFQVVVNPSPTLSSTLLMAPVCTTDSVIYTPTSATAGTSFQWNRFVIPGISNSGTTGTGGFSEMLFDTTANPILVNYSYYLVANGCYDTQTVNVLVRPNPVLSSSHSDSVCSGAPYNYSATSATGGVLFSWQRNAVSGISNSTNIGSGNVSETLADTTNGPVITTYVYQLNDSGCYNYDTLRVTVSPVPAFTSTLTPSAICDSFKFDYTPTSNVSGATFAWSRAIVPGISNPASSGTGSIGEHLYNTTNANVLLTYVYTVTANGCSAAPINLPLTVHPTPKLSSKLTATVCTDATFSYVPASYTAGTTFDWTRPRVLGLHPATNFGTGSVLETLEDSNYTVHTAVYLYRLTANGCVNLFPDSVLVTVNPGPDIENIQTLTPSSVCSNTLFQTFGAVNPPAPGVQYKWSATNATVYSTSPNEQFAYVNFYSPGNTWVFLTGTIEKTGCITQTSVPVFVGSGVADNPEVIYYNGQFICLESDEDTYQWGYDDNTTFSSTTLQGATGQNYYNQYPDFANNHYWVITTHNGCTQKSYYNVPTGVAGVQKREGDMRLYPNPASDNVNVEINTTDAGDMQLEVVNMLGQKLTVEPTINHKAIINVAGLPSGCYLVNCYKDNVKIATSRFIKN